MRRVLSRCYLLSDVPSTHLRITGHAPFEGKSFQEILTKNKLSKVDFSHKGLAKLPAPCLDLLKKMLRVKPEERPSAAECLHHEFLKTDEDSGADLNTNLKEDEVSSHLKEFQEK